MQQGHQMNVRLHFHAGQCCVEACQRHGTQRTTCSSPSTSQHQAATRGYGGPTHASGFEDLSRRPAGTVGFCSQS